MAKRKETIHLLGLHCNLSGDLILALAIRLDLAVPVQTIGKASSTDWQVCRITHSDLTGISAEIWRLPYGTTAPPLFEAYQ